MFEFYISNISEWNFHEKAKCYILYIYNTTLLIRFEKIKHVAHATHYTQLLYLTSNINANYKKNMADMTEKQIPPPPKKKRENNSLLLATIALYQNIDRLASGLCLV